MGWDPAEKDRRRIANAKNKQIAALKKEVERLRAIAKYAEHEKIVCNKWALPRASSYYKFDDAQQCTCGLDAARGG